MISKQDAGAIMDELRQKKGLTWGELGESLDRPPVWIAAAVLGMHPVPVHEAEALREILGIEDEMVDALIRQPSRALDVDMSKDPTIYRFHELIGVYGSALKSLIHDEFGDGIMSAINCSISLVRVPHADGDRVKVVIDGKFLPYAWASANDK